jgi:hypothetical protein
MITLPNESINNTIIPKVKILKVITVISYLGSHLAKGKDASIKPTMT